MKWWIALNTLIALVILGHWRIHKRPIGGVLGAMLLGFSATTAIIGIIFLWTGVAR